MKVRWPGVALVVLLVIGTLLLKSRTRNSVAPATVKVTPSVILIAAQARPTTAMMAAR